MVIIIACILLLAAIGGGIYVWVKRQRKNLLIKKTALADSSKILDPSKASVLDSVVSPVSTPSTSSTASDRPQINASSETSTGGDGTHLDGAGAATTSGPQPAIEAEPETKYTARFRQAAPTIKDLAEKLLIAWDQATEAHKAEGSTWDLVDSNRRTIYCGNDCRFIAASDDVPTFVIDLNKHFAGALTNYKNWLEKSAQVSPTAESAKAAFEALRLALKPFDEHRSESLPADLCVLSNTAYQVMRVSRESIEKLLKQAEQILVKVEKEELEGKPLKHDRMAKLFASDEKTFAEGTHKDDEHDTLEARESLKQAVIAAILEQFACKGAISAVDEVIAKLETLNKRSFTYPQKPTPEEITRFLTEVEEWSKEKLGTERQVAPLIATAGECIKALRDAVKALKRSRGRTVPVLTDANRMIDEALILATNKVVTDLETAIESDCADLAKATEKQPKVSPPVIPVSSEEEAKIKLLRADLRTLAFALAQRTVASTKLAQIQRDEPALEGMPPRVERGDAFAKCLERYQAYFERRNTKREAHCKWEAARDLIQMAYDARKAKVGETSKALSSKLAEVQKTSSAKPADELTVVGGMATKIVQLTDN